MRGLYQQRNSFTVPDGALETATNITIKNDNILSSRRGFHQYFNVTSGTLNNLFLYQETLLAMYNAKLSYFTDTGSSPNETGSETAITGETILNSNNRVSRSLQSNSNLYMTTDNGVLKMTAYTSDTFKTGAPQGLDLSVRFKNGTSSTFLSADKIVGYRVVFGHKDANDNLILGAPSQITDITNTQVTTATATNSGADMTVTSTAHGLVTGQYLIFSDAESSGPILEPNAEGTYQITSTGANTFTYTAGGTPGGSLTQLYYAYAMPVRLELSIPSEISTTLTWFYQVYRSSQQTSSVGIFSDFKLITEKELTSAEISANLAYFDDDIDDILLGAELYTNENSREGELQANYRPPLVDDIAYFKGHAIYAKATTRHLIDLAVIDTNSIATTDYIEVKSSVTRRYVAQTGVGNQTVRSTAAAASANLEITYTAHGFADGDSIRVDNITGSLVAGTYYVVSKAANTLEVSLTKGGASVSWTDETACEIQGITEQAGDYPMFFLSEDTSASIRLRGTAEAITKAMNRDGSSEVYAAYISGINDIPGKFRLEAVGFGSAISLLASDSTVAAGFSPTFPTSFSSGTQVTSSNEDLPHTFYAAKEGEPEAVPLVNRFPVGSKNATLFRSLPLRDSMILLKGDGVWRVTGDSPQNFTATLLDGTVICVAPNSVDIINNQVAFLSNQGVCFVTESSVQILSREGIEDPIQPILGQTSLATETAGIAYESERLYLLTTTEPNTTAASVTYAYNILTQEWSTWDRLFAGGVVGPKDKLFYIHKDDNDIQRERKNQDRTDYADQNHSSTIDAISGLTVTATCTTTIFQQGDMLIKNNVITHVDTVPELVAGNQYTFDVVTINNLEAADTPILYERFERIIKLAPFHAGLVGRLKFFAQMSILLRDNSMSKAEITFSGQTYGGSTPITWTSQTINAGWGNFPWGFEPWGQETGIELTTGTTPAPVLRIYIPPFQARNTFIQPIISHIQAGEPTNIQAFSFAVRPYGERLSI
tara:strand:+ start:1371 stop:4367 length:2997 start_codon:yes stop_codon:yes gene_type:complete